MGLSKTPVTARVRRLEEAGYIRGYRAELDAGKLGLEHVAFVEVRLSDTREAALQAFNTAIREIPEVEACHMIAGGFDYLVKVRTSNVRDYRRVLGEKDLPAAPYRLDLDLRVDGERAGPGRRQPLTLSNIIRARSLPQAAIPAFSPQNFTNTKSLLWYW